MTYFGFTLEVVQESLKDFKQGGGKMRVYFHKHTVFVAEKA